MSTSDNGASNTWIFSYWFYLRINHRLKGRSIDDLRNNKVLIGCMRKLAKLCDKYNDGLAKKYGVRIDIIECWKETLKYYEIDIIHQREDTVVKYMILHAKWQGEKLSHSIETTEAELEAIIASEQESVDNKIIENTKIVTPLFNDITYDSLFSKTVNRDIVDKALVDLNFLDEKGKGLLTDREKGKIAGLIKELIKYELIRGLSYTTLGPIFCDKLGLKHTRLKKDSAQCDEMSNKADMYFKKVLKSH